MFVISTYRITELHYTYGNATLSADYVGYLYFENYWLTPHITHYYVNTTHYWLTPTLRAAYVG